MSGFRIAGEKAVQVAGNIRINIMLPARAGVFLDYLAKVLEQRDIYAVLLAEVLDELFALGIFECGERFHVGKLGERFGFCQLAPACVNACFSSSAALASQSFIVASASCGVSQTR